MPGSLPTSFAGRLAWLRKAWANEPWPVHLHHRGVWIGDPGTGDHQWPAELTGGSKLGSPAWSEGFRRWIENSREDLDEDGSFIRPLAAAITELSHSAPLTARTLWTLGLCGFNWEAVALRGGWATEMYAGFVSNAIAMLYDHYRVAP